MKPTPIRWTCGTHEHATEAEAAKCLRSRFGPAPYGFCPHCGEPGVQRERRPNGNDTCSAGHVYPSRDSVGED